MRLKVTHRSTLGRALEHWLSTIPVPAKPTEEGAQTAGTRLFYKLKPTSVSGKWLLDIFKVSQLKSGELREVKPMYSLSEMLMRQPGYLSELDLRVARLLVAVHSHHAYYGGYPLGRQQRRRTPGNAVANLAAVPRFRRAATVDVRRETHRPVRLGRAGRRQFPRAVEQCRGCAGNRAGAGAACITWIVNSGRLALCSMNWMKNWPVI